MYLKKKLIGLMIRSWTRWIKKGKKNPLNYILLVIRVSEHIEKLNWMVLSLYNNKQSFWMKLSEDSGSRKKIREGEFWNVLKHILVVMGIIFFSGIKYFIAWAIDSFFLNYPSHSGDLFVSVFSVVVRRTSLVNFYTVLDFSLESLNQIQPNLHIVSLGNGE